MKSTFIARVVAEMRQKNEKVSPARLFGYINQHYDQESRTYCILFEDCETFLAIEAGEEPPDENEQRYLGRRVENLGKNVTDWSTRTGNGASTIDLCNSHAVELDTHPHRFDGVLHPYGDGEPVGEDGWGGDVEHPNYDESAIRCAIPTCQVLLGGW
jgi:hypothetical protein